VTFCGKHGVVRVNQEAAGVDEAALRSFEVLGMAQFLEIISCPMTLSARPRACLT